MSERRATYQTRIKEVKDMLPRGVTRAVLSIIGNCVGRSKAVSKARTLDVLHSLPAFAEVDERKMRDSIEELRRLGVRICAPLSGEGYYIAETEEEYKELRHDYIKRALAAFKTVQAMDQHREIKIVDEDTLLKELEREAIMQPELPL